MFETMMLICFAVSWPASIRKSFLSRSTKGKSLLFMCMISLGYLCGIINKLIHGYDLVLWVYVFDMCLVLTDMALYFRNRRIEKMETEVTMPAVS